MEIDITEFANQTAFTYSHSPAEGGDNAGRNTWNAAKSAPIQLLKTEEQRAAFRRHIAEFGAWNGTEIATFTEEELNGLMVQLVAGDIREAGFDTLEEIDWEEFEEQANAGRISGNLFHADDKYYYTLSY